MSQVPEQNPDGGAEFPAILEAVRKVAASAGERADQIDRDRKFPADLWEQLEASGAFRLCAPKRFGGLELSLGQANELVFEGARGTGSLGWLMMVGVAQSFGQGLFSEETNEKVLYARPNVRTRGCIAPKGMAVPVEGGYQVSGQWPFASGGPDPDYVTGNCIVMEDGRPKLGAEGLPEAVMAMMPASQLEFLDNWHALGMRGTDSCDVKADGVFVPLSMTFSLHDPTTCFDTPASRLPLRVALSFSHCALALGTGQGAVDDIVALSKTKRATMNPLALLAEDPVFRDELGRNAVRLRSVRAMLDQVTSECWKAGEENRELAPQQILTARLMAHHITHECLAIVSWAYTRAGSSSVYDGSSLQRRLRDIHVATQHASTHTDPYRLLAASMLGEELTPQELF